jgi:hypothetical protein
MQSGMLVLAFTEQISFWHGEKMVCVGTAFQQLMTDQSLQQRRSFSMNVGQDWVGLILWICYYEQWLFEVPVIVLWTKTDFLDFPKIKQLMKEGISRSNAIQQAPEKAWVDFENNIHQRFAEFKYPPKAYVVFQSKLWWLTFIWLIISEMHEPGGNCDELMKKTVAALSSEELQQLFVSTQQNNLDLCVKYGIKGWRLMICEIYHINMILRTMKKMRSDGLKYFKKKKGNWAYFIMMLGYFPHHVVCI